MVLSMVIAPFGDSGRRIYEHNRHWSTEALPCFNFLHNWGKAYCSTSTIDFGATYFRLTYILVTKGLQKAIEVSCHTMTVSDNMAQNQPPPHPHNKRSHRPLNLRQRCKKTELCDRNRSHVSLIRCSRAFNSDWWIAYCLARNTLRQSRLWFLIAVALVIYARHFETQRDKCGVAGRCRLWNELYLNSSFGSSPQKRWS